MIQSIAVQFCLASALVMSYSVHASSGSTLQNSECKKDTCGLFKMSDEQLDQDLKLLQRLVDMPSETNDIEGVDKVTQVVQMELEKIGFKINYFQNPIKDSNTKKPISADLLVAELKGKKEEFITFIVHVDTVFKSVDGKVPVPFQIVDSVKMPLQIDMPGKRILGSGTGDNKGGVVLLLRSLKMIVEKKASLFSLRVVVSTNEEVGSPGHSAIIAQYAKDSVAILGVEPSGFGNILNGRGGVHWYEVKVQGVEAHAGVAHERGVNACLDIAIKLAKISNFTDYANNITVNAGTITGGKRGNIVCGEATAVIDTRFPTLASDKELEKKMMDVFSKSEASSHDGQNLQTKTEVKTTSFVGTFESPKVSEPYIQMFLENIKSIDGLNAAAKYSRGGADISRMRSDTAIMIDGLGPVVDGSHTIYEYIVLESMRSRALLLADLVSKIGVLR